jgi:hypothetical protein
MWEENDLHGYNTLSERGAGQIYNDSFSEEIEKYASNLGLKTFLEIGTWNGLGSTKAFSDGLSKRSDDYTFYSLECNKDKSSDAAKIYADNDKIHILNEVIWNEEPDDFYHIFPQCKTNSDHSHWNEVDVTNMKKCQLFLNRPNLPSVFDVVLLDGGEFTTYHEFQLLKNRCRILMLDDIRSDKCKLVTKEIILDPTWKIVKLEEERNGFLIAEKIENL